jgi:arylsulfatase A
MWAALLSLFILLPSLVMANDRRPNILVVLADDLGYGDLACYGHPVIKTPHLDRFAREGLRFTDCYAAAANCSPARTGLMTGRTPTRVGIHNWIPMFSPMHVRRSEVTIATLLRNAGYATCHVGKWHLNGDFNLPSQPQPSDHGFDHWFSTQNNALPNHKDPFNFVRNGKPVGPLKGYAAPLVADEAIAWLEKGRDEQKPFFLYVCFHEPHEPIASDKRFADMYPPLAAGEPTRADLSRAAHHGNVTQMDDAFGRLAAALDRLKLSESTFLLFTSDNGPAITGIHPHGSAGPLRAKKGHLYDGGIRVPGILRWPGHTTAGETSDTPICGVDLLPTLCSVAGIPVPSDRKIDGTDILPLLEGKPVVRTTPLYWHFLRASSKTKVAMRIGDWKLLAQLDSPALKPSADLLPEEMKAIKTAELVAFELYNLKTDIGEKTDLAKSEPDRLARMSTAMKSLYHKVREESPVWDAWTWPRYESKLIEWPAYRNRR